MHIIDLELSYHYSPGRSLIPECTLYINKTQNRGKVINKLVKLQRRCNKKCLTCSTFQSASETISSAKNSTLTADWDCCIPRSQCTVLKLIKLWWILFVCEEPSWQLQKSKTRSNLLKFSTCKWDNIKRPEFNTEQDCQLQSTGSNASCCLSILCAKVDQIMVDSFCLSRDTMKVLVYQKWQIGGTGCFF